MQAFSLDPGSSIPVKLQLKAQVKYQVMAGMLRPGDQRPPLRDMAAGLGVHLNTVVRAFAELEEEGFLHSQQGRGVFVAEEAPGPGQGAALRSLLAGVLQSAREFGLAPEEMALAALAHGQLAKPPLAPSNRILLVGGSRTDLRRLQRQLETALPALVVPVLADELAERVRPGEYRLAACTLFHEADLRRHLPALEPTVLADEPDKAQWASLHELPPDTPVTITAGDWLHAARIRRSLELAGLGALDLKMHVGQVPAGPRLVIGDHLVITEPAELPATALAQLGRCVAMPPPGANIHLRSAWV